MSIELIPAITDRFSEALDAIASMSLDGLSVDELVDLIVELDQLESVARDMGLRLIGQLHRSAPPVALGGTPLATTLSTHLRISENEARRRIAEAIELGYG